MPTDLDTRIAEVREALEKMTRPLALHVVVQLDGNVRIDDAIEDAPFASMRQGQAEQKANAQGIVTILNNLPALLAALEERTEAPCPGAKVVAAMGGKTATGIVHCPRCNDLDIAAALTTLVPPSAK